ncbi:MAG: hypothetical protein CMH83_17875 [Nocardioides sp.]|nr:hypothetical protein [Nocardioides sp.]
MSQTASAPPPPAVQPGPAGPVASRAHAPERDVTEDTPRLLNRLQVVAVTVCLVFAVLAAVVQVLAFRADGRAADNTEQVVRVQEVRSLLLRADAIATTGFLVGGLEPADQRAAYDAAIDDVLGLLTDAADAQPADRAVLGDLNRAVSAYTTAVAQARDLNRQQLVIAIAYLNQAGSILREQALPAVDALVSANSARATDEMGGHHPSWLLGLALLALVGLWWTNRALAVRFHRRLNVGLLAAAGVVAVVAILGAANAGARASSNADTRDGPYRTAVDEAAARSAANDAKAAEALGLVNRGSGAVYEENAFDPAAAVVEENASPITLNAWRQYVEQHDVVRQRDDRGSWDRAVELATSEADDAPSALLAEVDATAAQVTEENAALATDGFSGGGALTLGLALLTLLGGLAAAGAATWGVNQRRREYA